MKTYSLLFFCLLFFAMGCGQDGICEESLPSIEQYIEDNNLSVTEGEQGLKYIITEPGSAERPTIASAVTVNYTGTLTNDQEFDSNAGRAAITFPLSNVITGWQLGIPLVGRGGRIQLFIPSEIAYGNQLVAGICPNSDLIFEVELVNFTE